MNLVRAGQNTIGDHAVRRLFDANTREADSTIEIARCGHNFIRIPISFGAEKIQTKLTINQPGDHYEQEADAVADKVMRMPESETPSKRTKLPVTLNEAGYAENIQRLSADRNPSLEDAVVSEKEENEAEEGQVQTLRSHRRTSSRKSISRGLLNSSQDGVPLESSVRQFMEPRFGADFSRVRIHADHRAAALSQSLSARAFTYGPHIFFNASEYQPATQEGKRVLAHELTHVIQQGSSQAQSPEPLQVTAAPGATMAPRIQKLGALGRETRHNVAPWGNISSGPTGSDYEVNTDGGTTVSAWKAYPVWQHPLLYWCHGHSLDTFYRYGYSVYSGTPMAAVVRDELTSVASNQAAAGDLAVWTAGFDHSALFTNPVIENGQLVAARSELSTKNGQSAARVMTLGAIMGIYGSGGVAVFRRR